MSGKPAGSVVRREMRVVRREKEKSGTRNFPCCQGQHKPLKRLNSGKEIERD
jgi:hypothetical protein